MFLMALTSLTLTEFSLHRLNLERAQINGKDALVCVVL